MYGDGSATARYGIRTCSVVTVTEPHVATFAEIDSATLYALLRLRCDVFIVEQECAYPDLDGRDLESGTRHVWLTSPAENAGPTDRSVGRPTAPVPAASHRAGEPASTTAGPVVLAYLRILEERDGTVRIGRVCVARDARRAGHAATLMTAALEAVGDRAVVLDAQRYATKLYEDAGFVPDGPEFLEDGIPHVPMRRHPRSR